ncbi:hypothetical protein C7S20_14870 [Christiangramia fulva]|uniref:Uncharacterized protein n=1 Tax=Christiangramia fulva TaxID=2126553 RepID=A0A2R3Z825_9FLAO|nr:hypothetical protein [Christiangramia fulva]AVR46443.1 hypothetical protein C7S20_14870 [Christiangramia fulva]
MKILKHIFFVFTALILLFPPVVNFIHIFEGHDHKPCIHYADSHYHKKNINCELYKFHSNPALELDFINFEPFLATAQEKVYSTFYFFLNDLKLQQASLRAPPAFLFS